MTLQAKASKQLLPMANGIISSMVTAIGCMKKNLNLARPFEWSPKGNYIAYYRFDETNVKEYNMTIYDNTYNKDYL